jgi:hypothetical protein
MVNSLTIKTKAAIVLELRAHSTWIKLRGSGAKAEAHEMKDPARLQSDMHQPHRSPPISNLFPHASTADKHY